MIGSFGGAAGSSTFVAPYLTVVLWVAGWWPVSFAYGTNTVAIEGGNQ